MSVQLRLLALMRPYWGWMAAAALAGLFTVLANVGLMATSAYLIAKAAQRPEIHQLLLSITGVRFFGTSRGVFRYAERLLSHEATFRLLGRLRAWLFERLIPLAPAVLARQHSGDVMARVTQDVQTLEHYYVRVLGPSLVALGTLGLVAFFLGRYDPVLALSFALFFVLAGVVWPLWIQRLARLPGRARVTARAKLKRYAVDLARGLAELLVFGGARERAARLEQAAQGVRQAEVMLARIEGLGEAGTLLLANGSLVAALWLGGVAVSNGGLRSVDLGVVSLATLAAFEAAFALPLAWQTLGAVQAAATRIFDLADTPLPVRDPQRAASPPAALPLVLEGVSYRYPGDARWVVEGLDLRLEVGERLLLAGPSGSGKTTLAWLLLKFLEPTSGRISMAGQDYRELAGDEVRRRFAVLDQRPHLFAGSLRENLLLAKPEASEAELWQALERAQLADWVRVQPSGLDADLGEDGAGLSGGQARRLALARALLREAPIWILDEPTEGLDPPTAQSLIRVLDKALEGKTLFVISHAPLALDFDRVLELR